MGGTLAPPCQQRSDMADDKKKCDECAENATCQQMDVPTYTVEALLVAEREGKKGLVVKEIVIEQLNSIGWPIFIHEDMPRECRDGVMAAVLAYKFDKPSIDEERDRVRKIRENLEKTGEINKEGTFH